MKDFLKNAGLLLFIDIFTYLFIIFPEFALEIYTDNQPVLVIIIFISAITQLIFRFKKRYILSERFILSLSVFIFLSHYKGINIICGTIIIFSAVIRCITTIFLNKAGNRLFFKLNRKKSALVMTAIYMTCTIMVSALGAYRQSEYYTRTTGTVVYYGYDGCYTYFVNYEDLSGIIHNESVMRCPDIYGDTKFQIFKKGDKINIVYPKKSEEKYESVRLYIKYTPIIISASVLLTLCILLTIKPEKSKTESV